MFLCLLAEFPKQLFCSRWVVCWLSVSSPSVLELLILLATSCISFFWRPCASCKQLACRYLPDSLSRFDPTFSVSEKELSLAQELWNVVRELRSYFRGVFCRSYPSRLQKRRRSAAIPFRGCARVVLTTMWRSYAQLQHTLYPPLILSPTSWLSPHLRPIPLQQPLPPTTMHLTLLPSPYHHVLSLLQAPAALPHVVW